MLKGRGASPGIAIGEALVLDNQKTEIKKTTINAPDREIKRLTRALEISRDELEAVCVKVSQEIGAKEAAIFEAHLMILQDPEFMDQIRGLIEGEHVNADYAVKAVGDRFIAMFQAMENEYMRERAADVRDVTSRVIDHLLGRKRVDLSALDKPVILVADDLTPSDTATMNRAMVRGFLTNIGGRTSHSAIMARTLEIPAVVGLGVVTTEVRSGDRVAFNGESGEVWIEPDEVTIRELDEKQKKYLAIKRELDSYLKLESATLDGHRVRLEGNIGTPKDVEVLERNGAEGVGLYRTEFLFMDRDHMPSEDVQFEAYKKVLEAMSPRPVVIRTLDIGGDKKLPYLPIAPEMNPFLGYRAMRISLDQVDGFRIQLRSLLRASCFGALKIMFPMISSLEEVLQAKALVADVSAELRREGVEPNPNIQLGIMIEIPSAAMVSDELAKHVDFFSIGTNDLIQYSVAVDRMNEKIQHLYSNFHPGVLRLINMVIENAHREGKWVGMCGEMACAPELVPVLLGMGLDDFSMSPISILPVRKQVRGLRMSDCQALAREVLGMGSATQVEARLRKLASA
jgi:phosphotransferase system enzyme I (PtsI)